MCEAKPEHYSYRGESIRALLLSSILGLCGCLKMILSDKDTQEKYPSKALFRQFFNLLNSTHSKVHTVEYYAEQLCVSPKHLSTVCKRNSGKTAYAWIREHLLEEIRYYLKQTDMPMKQIADELGFANPSFFGKYVKEHFGMTPLRFRYK